jgi:hypothetical protein
VPLPLAAAIHSSWRSSKESVTYPQAMICRAGALRNTALAGLPTTVRLPRYRTTRPLAPTPYWETFVSALPAHHSCILSRAARYWPLLGRSTLYAQPSTSQTNATSDEDARPRQRKYRRLIKPSVVFVQPLPAEIDVGTKVVLDGKILRL